MPATSYKGSFDAAGKRFAIVVSRWNEFATKQLLEGALDEFARCGDPEVEVFHVPGTWEIPVVAAALAQREANRPDGIVALGCILQGATGHAGQLAHDVSAALMELMEDGDIVVTWGIITPENQEQAIERSGMKLGNKGREAALAAIEVASLLSQAQGS